MTRFLIIKNKRKTTERKEKKGKVTNKNILNFSITRAIVVAYEMGKLHACLHNSIIKSPFVSSHITVVSSLTSIHLVYLDANLSCNCPGHCLNTFSSTDRCKKSQG